MGRLPTLVVNTLGPSRICAVDTREINWEMFSKDPLAIAKITSRRWRCDIIARALKVVSLGLGVQTG